MTFVAFTLFFFKNLLYFCESFACVCICVPHVPLVPRGQKRVSNALELEFQMVVSHHVGAGNCIQVFCKSGGCS